MYKIAVLALFLVASVSSFNEETWYKKFIPDTYNKEVAPLYNDEPFYTNVSMYYIQLYNFEPYHMQVTADVYVRYLWKDYRLVKKGEQQEKYYDIPMPEGKKYLYVPDVFFTNAMKVEKPQGPNSFMKFYPAEGHLMYSQKVQIKFPCQSEIRYFPFDYIKCDIHLESYGLTSKSMYLRWKGEPKYNKDIKHQTSYELKLMNFEHEMTMTTLETGTYERLTSTFTFQRNFGYYLKSFFLPNIFYMVMGYMAFFINVKDLFSRMFLTCIVLLMHVMTVYFAQSSLPMTYYFTPLDVFNGLTFGFLFFTIFESIIVYKFTRMNELEEKPEGVRYYMYRMASGADRFFSFLYPVLFTLFITIYSAVCFA